jgi:hypothetical protein
LADRQGVVWGSDRRGAEVVIDGGEPDIALCTIERLPDPDDAVGVKVLVAPLTTVEMGFDTNNTGRWVTYCRNTYHLESGVATLLYYSTSTAAVSAFECRRESSAEVSPEDACSST